MANIIPFWFAVDIIGDRRRPMVPKMEPSNEWNAETYERLEAALIGADLGVNVSTKLVASIRDRYERGLIKTTEDIILVARHDIGETLTHPAPIIRRDDGPTVILDVEPIAPLVAVAV